MKLVYQLFILAFQITWEELQYIVQSDYFPLVLSNLVIFSFFIYLYWSDHNQQNKYDGRIARLEDSTKRAQMNPHFIFNALNGVQSILLHSSAINTALTGSSTTVNITTNTTTSTSATEANKEAILTILERVLLKISTLRNVF
jgi:LytS/YehU family sensor histidine kinase